VLRGAGEMQFRPSDEAERGQLALFVHKPELVTPIETVFIRLSPEEFSTRVSGGSLAPVPVVAEHAARALAVVDERGQRAYYVGLGDLSSARWSVMPPTGDVLVDMQTSKYGWLTYTRAAEEPEDVSLFDRLARKNISVYASSERRRSRGRFYSEDDAAKFDVEQVDLDTHIDPDRSTASGRATLHIRILKDGVNSLQLRLAETLAVQSVTSEQLGRLLSLRTVSQNGLIVSLPVPLARGSELTVTIAYGGRLAPQPLDREALTYIEDGRSKIEDGSTIEDGVIGQDEALPLPEPLFAYSSRTYWYPQPATSDFATARITLHVPSRFQVLATGTMVGAPATPGGSAERTVSFVADRPVRYLACVMTRLTPIAKAGVSVAGLAYPTAPELGGSSVSQLASPSVIVETVAQAREVLDAKSFGTRAAAIITFFTGIVGEAPYPSFTVATVDGLAPGGHSPPYFAVLNQPLAPLLDAWRDDPVAFNDQPWFLLAHEVAHQWWGQAVGGKNYHEQWLSEGLAQYFALRYVAADRGADTAHDILARMRDTALANLKAGPIYLGYRLGHVDSNPRAFRGVLYNKSAFVLHMLRQLIGDETFSAGLRRYYHDQRFSKAGTQDLQFAFEIESQRQLGRFFDQWILGATIPKLRVTTRVESSADAAVVHVEQIGEVFDVPITVLVTYETGQTEPFTVGISQAIQDVRVAAKGKIRRIRVDEALTLAEFAK
jgi:hypothetical protein